ncbi:membrane protein containing DUF1355 [Rhodopirellula sallentina SM41]|uniref:Membrane protein containing DUF1355 n=1 Tax=Rhodopirellula sallentina SM41 TaxID=1263870 RepID=M5U3U9_9BACT|nr:membrane protein containing DUF1355 [Rhodopirellula sallentina SM41]
MTEGLQANGTLGWNASLVVIVVLCVATVWWLSRQRELLGTPTFLLLILLRVIVVFVAVWMIIQPSWTRTETVSRRAEIVVLADGSGSMDTVDPPATRFSNDWNLAVSNPDDPLAMVQRIELDLQMANKIDTNQSKLLQRAIEQLSAIPNLSPDLSEPCLTSLRSALESSSDSSETLDRAQQLARAASRTDAVESALLEIEILRTTLQSERSSSNAGAPQSRKEFVARLLDRFEQQLKQLPGQPVSLRRAVFSDDVEPVQSASWSDALEIDQGDRTEPNGAPARTNVASALSYVRSLDPAAHLAAVLMLSEGQHNATSDQTPVEAATALLGTPVFTVPIGNQSRRRDIAIHRVNAPAIAYQDDRPVAEILVSSYECEGDEVTVTLLDEEGTIDTQTILFPSEISDVAVRFELPPSPPGRKQYRIKVESVVDEISQQNNQAVFSVQTIKSKLYLLIADRQPRWEYRYLEQLFRRDQRVELDKFLLMPTLKTTLTDASAKSPSLLPSTIDGWSKFDVAILGDLPPDVMTPDVCQAMEGWVKAGGNIIVVAGEHAMPAAYRLSPWFGLLPITSQPMAVSRADRPTPAPEGFTHPAIRLHDSLEFNSELWRRWMSGPTPGYLSPFHSAKPTASVLASLSDVNQISSSLNDDAVAAPDNNKTNLRPAWLSVHRVGSGQVAYLSSPISYRLRIRAGDMYHHRFWGQLVRWMTSAELSSGDGMVDIKSDRAVYDEGQRSGIRVRLSDASGLPVRRGDVRIRLAALDDIDGEFPPRTVKLVENELAAGVYEISVDRLPPGVYQATAIGPTIDTLRKTSVAVEPGTATTSENSVDTTKDPSTTTFTVQSAGDVERLMTEADPLLLSQIAEASGGVSIFPAALEEVLHVVSLAPDVTKTQRMTPLWNRWANLWIIVGCLTTDWWIRRRKGLI